ncbi:MAG: hypothetical protein ACFFA3_02890 [Promethearchaeota archaeon]
MSNKKILYLYTEDLNFFYKLNRELKKKNIQFKILSGTSKIPDLRVVLLTTLEDIRNLKGSYKKLKLLAYGKHENFNHYVNKILAAYRIGYKEFYSELVFSIDPGSKKIGMVVFLDDYYLVSHTFYDREGIITIVKDYINCFQSDNPNPLKLTFKFGSGLLTMTIELIERISELFRNGDYLNIFLINESKSSKLKIQNLKKKFKTKHELSALILALRKGIKIDYRNSLEIYKKAKMQNSNYIMEFKNIRNSIENFSNFQEFVEKILKNEISLSESSELVNKVSNHGFLEKNRKE